MLVEVGKLLPYVTLEFKRKIIFLSILMVLCAILEIASIGAVIPFLGILLDPLKVISEFPFLTYWSEDTKSLRIILSSIFIFIIVLSGVLRFILLTLQKKLGHRFASYLGETIYSKILYQSYEEYIRKNSSMIISGISTKVSVVAGNVLIPILQLFSSVLILTSVLSVTLVFFFKETLGGLSLVLILYLIIVTLTKKRLVHNSSKISLSSDLLISHIQESLKSLRDIKLNGQESFFIKKYSRFDQSLRNAKAVNEIISGSPKFIIETFGFVIIALIGLIYSVFFENNLSSIIPVLGAIAVGSQKLFPLVQQVYASRTMIMGELDSFNDIIALLSIPSDKTTHLKKTSGFDLVFNHKIQLEDICFCYKGTDKTVLNKINLSISKGKCIGIIGDTGSGKSTLIDLISGFLYPNEGSILIDGERLDSNNILEWRSKIAYVPQKITLNDSSVKENIAFGIESDKIDLDKVRKAANIALVDEFIDLEADVKSAGEDGIKFSGGQIQRIGLARALYKNSELLILDEATSALDPTTENLIVKNLIQNTDATIIMIAHRLTSLRFCDQIIEINKGEISRKLSFNDLILESDE